MKKTDISSISIVLPFYNEEENVSPVLDEVTGMMKEIHIPFEIVAVDDGSRDNTWQRLEEKKSQIPELKLVKLKRNFGQTHAMAAGIHAAVHDWILTMDGDGQNDPHSLPLLLERAREGYDVVSGWRKKRKDYALRSMLSRNANRLLAAITGLMLHDSGCALKLYKAHAIRSISLYSDRHRFLPFLLHMKGFRVAEVAVNHRPRTRGKSKYGLSRVGKVFLDLLALALFARFREAPQNYFFLTALPFMVLAVLFMISSGVVGFGSAFLCFFGAVSLSLWGFLTEWIHHFERNRENEN